MANFWIGVLASLSAMLIGFVIVQIKTRAALSWSTLSLFWSLARRLKEAGVSNVFPSRSDYRVHRKERSISDYVLTAKRELIYVGFWFAEGIEIDNTFNAMLQLLEKGCTVELVLMAQDLDTGLETKIADYLAISSESLHSRLVHAWADTRRFRAAISDDLKTRFILRSHKELVTSSAFIFDYGADCAKTLVDFKLYGAGRTRSFGIELKPSNIQDSLYLQTTVSFLGIKKKSLVIA